MTTPPQERPNVIVFLTDQQRWDTSGLHGNPLDLMPNFDRMAQRGTHVFNSFTNYPLCGPARACFQTGLYATQTGCYRNGIALPRQAKTLAHYFRAGGYTTGYIGKWHLADDEPVLLEQRGGYEYWLAANLLEFTSEPYDTVVFDNENKPTKLPGYRVDALTDAAIRYIDAQQLKPFYLFISYLEPHHQNHTDDYPAPDGYRERYTGRWIPPDLAALGGSTQQHIAGYYGQVKRLDEALGRLFDALKSLGLYDRSIVLYTADHGNHFKTRNGEYKRSCHESSIRVPTAFQGPGLGGRGRLQELVSLIDLPPTLLDAAGLAVPTAMQGRSLMSQLDHRNTNWPQDIYINISESQVGRAIRTQRWKYSVSAPKKDGWNDASSEDYVEEFLYDLQSDPYELTNLIGFESHLHTAAQLRERLIVQMVSASESAPSIALAPTQPSGERGETPQSALRKL